MVAPACSAVINVFVSDGDLMKALSVSTLSCGSEYSLLRIDHVDGLQQAARRDS